MILDKELEFSDAQSVSGASAVKSSVVADLVGTAGLKDAWGAAITPDIGEAGRMKLNVRVNTAMVGASITVTATLVTKAADASIDSGGTTIATLLFPAISAAGTQRSVHVPAGSVLRFLGVLYTPSGSLTSSKFDAWIGLDHSTV